VSETAQLLETRFRFS